MDIGISRVGRGFGLFALLLQRLAKEVSPSVADKLLWFGSLKNLNFARLPSLFFVRIADKASARAIV